MILVADLAVLERPDHRARSFRHSLSVIVIIFASTGIGFGCRREPPVTATADGGLAAALPRRAAEGSFASSSQCRECHPSEHASWHASFHRQMTQIARADSVLGPFDGGEIEDAGQVHRMVRRGDELWVESRPTGEDSASAVSRRVVMTTGAHHMQLYWTASGKGNLLDELPIVYIRDPLPGKSRWAPLEATYLSASLPGIEPHWNKDCILCHATGGRPGVDAEATTADTKIGEFGIACEACHGPAERHVQLNRERKAIPSASIGGSKDEQAIINPARLHPERSAQVCGHCHALASFVSDRLVEDFYLTGSSYRPGDDLLQTRLAVLPARLTPEQNEANRRYNPYYDGSYWPDGMVRVAGREYNGLIESTCYQKGGMTCLSCHSMHDSDPNDQLAVGKEGNNACYQCHPSYRDEKTLTAHTHHRADSTGSQCYNCHMPHTTYGLFKAIRSHQISSPTAAASVATGRPAACNLCHLDQTLGWTAETLSQWYGQPEPELDEQQRSLSAAAMLLIGGDTVQRALMAWCAGWQPALDCSARNNIGTAPKQQAGGNDWLAPLLAELLGDDSPPVRLMAWRSLAAVDRRYAIEFDFVAPLPRRLNAGRRVVEQFLRLPRESRSALGRRALIDEDGQTDRGGVGQLRERRDRRQLRVSE